MLVRVVVDNRIRVWASGVPAAALEELKGEFSHHNPAHAKLKAMGYRFDHRKEPREIKTWGEGGGWVSLPRGGMGRLRAVLQKHGLKWAVEDRRSDGDARWGPGFTWPTHLLNPDGSKRDLYEDQERVVEACERKQNCIVRSGTGSGKTTSLFALAIRLKLPTLIVVWTGGLFDQWVERIQSELGIDPRWIGRVRGGVRTYGPITVAMQQTIAAMQKRDRLPRRHDDFFDRFGLFGFDEVHKAAASSFFASVDPFTARYRVGVSDDERRADRKDFMIYDLFGDVVVEVTREELVAKSRVLDVAVRIVPTGWRPAGESPEADALLGDPKVDRSDSTALLDLMGADEGRAALAVEWAARYAREGHQVLVFSLRREHCMAIDQRLAREGVRSGLLVGGDDYRVSFQETLQGLRDGSLRVGVGTVQAIGTGIDLPLVSRGVVAMPIASNRGQVRQVTGRICRAGEGKDAEVAYLFDEKIFPDHFGRLSKASAAPTVWMGGRWVAPKEWRRAQREAAAERRALLLSGDGELSLG